MTSPVRRRYSSGTVVEPSGTVENLHSMHFPANVSGVPTTTTTTTASPIIIIINN